MGQFWTDVNKPSVGSIGDSYDNALAETIIGLYKTEVIHRRGPWRHLDAVEYATLEWVDWFNHRRLLEPIGNIPPAELEMAYHEMKRRKAKRGFNTTRGWLLAKAAVGAALRNPLSVPNGRVPHPVAARWRSRSAPSINCLLYTSPSPRD